jgi:hypothetical protein
MLTQLPTDILTVRAVDKDTQRYNSEVYYSVNTPQDVATVNRSSGVVTLQKRFPKDYTQHTISISAKDGGSPQRSGGTKVNIIFKILSGEEFLYYLCYKLLNCLVNYILFAFFSRKEKSNYIKTYFFILQIRIK